MLLFLSFATALSNLVGSYENVWVHMKVQYCHTVHIIISRFWVILLFFCTLEEKSRAMKKIPNSLSYREHMTDPSGKKLKEKSQMHEQLNPTGLTSANKDSPNLPTRKLGAVKVSAACPFSLISVVVFPFSQLFWQVPFLQVTLQMLGVKITFMRPVWFPTGSRGKEKKKNK